MSEPLPTPQVVADATGHEDDLTATDWSQVPVEYPDPPQDPTPLPESEVA